MFFIGHGVSYCVWKIGQYWLLNRVIRVTLGLCVRNRYKHSDNSELTFVETDIFGPSSGSDTSARLDIRGVEEARSPVLSGMRAVTPTVVGQNSSR